jgi:hypothetical protein
MKLAHKPKRSHNSIIFLNKMCLHNIPMKAKKKKIGFKGQRAFPVASSGIRIRE